MTKDEALKLAMDALESARQNHGLVLTSYPTQEAWHFHRVDEKISVALAAIKEALAQPPEERNFCPRCGKRAGKNDFDVHTCSLPEPEQEPVAYVEVRPSPHEGCGIASVLSHKLPVGSWQLYTTPPQRTWVGLTNDEIVDAYDVAIVSFKRSQQGIRGQMFTPSDSPDWHYAKAIEAKLKEKNT